MMYKCNLDVINVSIEAQDELNKIAYQKALERKKKQEEARLQRMAEIEAKKLESQEAPYVPT